MPQLSIFDPKIPRNVPSVSSVFLQLQPCFNIGIFYDEKLHERRMETVISEEALLPERM